MKKITILMALLLIVPVVMAQNVDRGSLRLSLVNQEPDPVTPGEFVDIRFKLENSGDTQLNNVEIMFVTSEYFRMDLGKPSTIEIGTLTAFQTEDRAKIIKYQVKVNENAVEGPNEVEVRVRIDGGEWSTYRFMIDVRTSDAIIALDSVKVTPIPAVPGDNTVVPGNDANVKLVIHNLADSNLKDVTVTLDLAQISTGTVNIDALPFAPLESGTTKNIKSMGPNEKREIEFLVKAYPTAESKVYKIPVLVSYKDELDTEYTRAEIISIIVNSIPDLSVVLADSDITKTGMKGEVSIQFINKGLTDIKFVDVILADSDEYTLLGPHEVYIGNIESDDYENADYMLYVEKGNKSEILLPISYTYMDSNNNKYSKKMTIGVKLFNNSRALEIGIEKPPADYTKTILFVIALVVLFIGYRVYKKWRK